MKSFVIESQREIPVLDKTDVLVAGGGTAGVVAAIAAARSGVKVVLVEQFGSLGGSATNALVTPHMHTGIEGNPLCSSISEEINRRIFELGYGAVDNAHNSGYFDPEVLKFVLEEMAVESGVDLLYYTFISDVIIEEGSIKGVIVENKWGRSVILAKRTIDCTGDGDVCAKSGVPYDKGNPSNGKNQPISVRYMMSGIDLDRFAEYIKTLDKDFKYEKPFFYMASVWEMKSAVVPVFQEAYDAGDITYEDGAYWQVFEVPGRKDTLAFNCPEIFEKVDGTNPYHLTEAQVYAKRTIIRLLKFYKKYFRGFENAYVTNVAPMVGIRETRRVKCIYTLKDEDVIMRKKFEDGIARSNYPIDIHGFELIYEELKDNNIDEMLYYEIPYRCLVAEGVKGLLVAGRCISADFVAQSSIRIQPTVRAMGEAAGIAAALSVHKNINLDEIRGESVRNEMIKRGARF